MKNIDITDKMLFLINTNKLPDYPFYLVHIGSLVNQHPCVRPDGLPDYQLLYCIAGEGLFTVDGHEYHITAGMGVLLKPDAAHEYHAIREPWSTYWVRFPVPDVICSHSLPASQRTSCSISAPSTA